MGHQANALASAARQLRPAVAAFDSSDAFQLFDFGRFKVLFRIDGLSIRLSDVAWDLLATHVDQDLEHRLERTTERYGLEEVLACTSELKQIQASGLLDSSYGVLPQPELSGKQPGGILLMVTQTCNLACRYCYGGGGTYGSKTRLMQFERARRAIDLALQRAPDRKKYTITFFGGEPLLNFRLIEQVVAYCQARGEQLGKEFAYSMTTNGTVLTDRIRDFLKDKRFTLVVSLDGPAEIQDRYRPFRHGKESYGLVVHNIRRLTAAGIPVQLRATLVKHTIDEGTVDRIVALGEELGCRSVMMTPVDAPEVDPADVEEALAVDGTDLERLLRIYHRITTTNIDRALKGAKMQVLFDPHALIIKALAKGKAVGLTRCGACFGMSAVSSDGKIYPCHRFVGMHHYAIGDLSSGVDPERVQGFFDGVAKACEANCASCWARLICGGTCYHLMATGDGGFELPAEAVCDSFRESLKNAIGFLTRLRAEAPHEAVQYAKNLGTIC